MLQDRGFKVALVTDGPHVRRIRQGSSRHTRNPEASDGGPIARIQTGDLIRLDAVNGTLEVLLAASELASRPLATANLHDNEFGMGRELFAPFVNNVGPAITVPAYSSGEK